MPALTHPSLLVTTPITEYNLCNERHQVTRTLRTAETVEYGDWGIVSADGTADYDFTHSDGGLLFLETARQIRADMQRGPFNDRTKAAAYDKIRLQAVSDLVHEIQEAGLWVQYVKLRQQAPEPWNIKKYDSRNGPPDSPRSVCSSNVALLFAKTPPYGGSRVYEMPGNGNSMGHGS